MTENKNTAPGTSDASLQDLFATFAKIGVMTFGGGAAMLPMLQREVIENKNWVDEEELLDYYAIGQCTPGIIAINTATFVGYRKKGITGGIAATLGMVFPSLVIITLLAGAIRNFADIPAVISAFAGIRVCVCVLILNAVLKLQKKSLIDWLTTVIFAVVLAGSYFLDLSPVLFVIVSAAVGIIVKSLSEKKGGEE